MRSPRNRTANSANHAEMVNSSAKTVANGNSVIASAQQICEPKWMTPRVPCSAIRCHRSPASSSRLTAANARRISRLPVQRTDIISNTLRLRASARTEIAPAMNANTLPLIQSATEPTIQSEREGFAELPISAVVVMPLR